MVFIACTDQNAEYSLLTPSCDITCETYNKTCTSRTVSKSGCACKPGYVQNCQGLCLLQSDYCRTCGPNKFYTDCGGIPAPSCQYPRAQPNDTSPGCQCNTDYILDYDGNCILPKNCPSMLSIQSCFY